MSGLEELLPFFSFLLFAVLIWLLKGLGRNRTAEKKGARKNAADAAKAAAAVGTYGAAGADTTFSELMAAAKASEVSGTVRRERPKRTGTYTQKADTGKTENIRRWAKGMALEDDEHDWLAQQLREEEQAYQKVSAMFQLKMSHAANCQAEKLRTEHEADCDAEKLRTFSVAQSIGGR